MNFFPLVLLFALFFLAGCAGYDQIRHETFSMKIPQWEQQELAQVTGVTQGAYFSDDFCSLNLTISKDTPLQVAYPFFGRLRALDPTSLLQYEVFESWISLHYKLGDHLGDALISTCPSGFTYFADFSCAADAYDSYSSLIRSSLDSMTC